MKKKKLQSPLKIEFLISKRTSFKLWSIKSKDSERLNLNKPENKYMIIRSKDDKIYFEGKFRITTKGKTKGESTRYQICLQKMIADDISNYKEENNDGIIVFEILTLTDLYYANYYFKLKDINKLHIEYGFGASTKIPGVFSESFIRYYYNLAKSKTREYDAIDFDEKRIEIKASSSKNGTVTMNPKSEFDFLFWLSIDFERDEFKVFKTEYSVFRDFLKKNETKKRVTLALSNFIKSEQILNTYNLTMEVKQ